jgi:hypothetical protein
MKKPPMLGRDDPLLEADSLADDATVIARSRAEPDAFARYDLTYRDARPWLFGIATNMIGRHRQAEVRFYRALARTGVDPQVDQSQDGVSC